MRFLFRATVIVAIKFARGYLGLALFFGFNCHNLLFLQFYILFHLCQPQSVLQLVNSFALDIYQ